MSCVRPLTLSVSDVDEQSPKDAVSLSDMHKPTCIATDMQTMVSNTKDWTGIQQDVQPTYLSIR
jgi:hypothetical protein